MFTKPYGLLGTGGKNRTGSESPDPPPCSHSSWALLLSRCFMSMTETVWFIRDRGRVGWGVRAQVHLPIHTAPGLFFFQGALHPWQKPYGLLGTGEEWDMEWEPSPFPCSHSSAKVCHRLFHIRRESQVLYMYLYMRKYLIVPCSWLVC